MFTAVSGEAAKRAMAGSRFADLRWVDETGSTNADLLALARDGAPEGIVLVADHQTAGRGRAGRSWVAPPGSSLLLSVLVRPPASVAGLSSMAIALAAADAVGDLAGFRPRLKWPNDLVWPGDGTAPDRKLAGILAEAHWPSEHEVAVVVGIGVNVNWPADLPEALEDVA
ncbi:MAG: BirA family transcriptional regulator, partial [Actinomycetota bacterium]|nr:BirA family transcriptional regulator [Actinomycetota bacterium]